VYDFHFVIKQRTGAGSIPAGEPSEFFSFLAFVIKTYLPLRIERSAVAAEMTKSGAWQDQTIKSSV
jgi:hypothetical protein